MAPVVARSVVIALLITTLSIHSYAYEGEGFRMQTPHPAWCLGRHAANSDALTVSVYAVTGENDPDAELVRFTVSSVSARALPTVDVDENDAYCVGYAEGDEVWRLPTQYEVGRDVAWPDEIRTFDLPLPVLENAPGPHDLTVRFFDEDEDGDDDAGTASIDLVSMPYGVTDVVDLSLVDPEPGMLTLTIDKAIVEKSILVTAPIHVPEALPAGSVVDVEWEWDGLISQVTIVLASAETGLGEIELASRQANTGQLSVTLPHWLEDGNDYELRVYDARSRTADPDGEGDGEWDDEVPATVVGYSSTFSVTGATLALRPINGGEVVLGVALDIFWDVEGLVTDITLSLRRGGTIGHNDGVLVSGAPLVTGEDASGSLSYMPALNLETGADYRFEITGTVEGVRALSASSGYLSFTHISVQTPSLITPLPHATGTAVSTNEEVVITFVASSQIEEVLIGLQLDGSDHLVIANATPNDGVFLWTVPDNLSPLGEEYTVHIESAVVPALSGDSEAFVINGPTVTVLPVEDGADLLLLGTQYDILWVARGNVETVDIELLINGQMAQSIASAVDASSGTFTWPTGVELPRAVHDGSDGISLDDSSQGSGAPDEPGRPVSGQLGDYVIRVVASSTPPVSGVSDAFTLAYSSNAPGFPGVSPFTAGMTVTVEVRARPSASGAYVFASLVEHTGVGALASWPELASIGVIPLPAPAEPHAPVTASMQWVVPVSKRLTQLAAAGHTALALRLRLLDDGDVYDGVSAAFGVLIPRRYAPGEWSACTAECDGGSRTRSLECRTVADFGDETGNVVPLSQCSNMFLAAPATQQQCNTFPCSGHAWSVSDWGECSAPCGDGERVREVSCVGNVAGDAATVPDSECEEAGLEEERPAEVEPCFTMPCESFSWKARGWTECSAACGGGMRYRSVECVGSYGTVISSNTPDSPCAAITPPASSEPCNIDDCAPYMWQATPWSTCSARCGGGTAERSVACVETDSGDSVDESMCDADLQLASQRNCNTAVCRENARFWQSSTYSACSAPCDGGVKTRQVVCVTADGDEVDEEECSSEESGAGAKPAETVACSTHACDACADEPCGDNGTCSADEAVTICECDEGFGGAFCATPDTCDGNTDASNECCAGILLAGGECCGTDLSARVDSNGDCCDSGVVDACGVCNGEATVVSVTGECCGPDAAADLDGAGLCCNAGFVDVCGVCGGDGTSCSVVAQVHVGVPEGTDAAAVLVADSAERLEFEVNTFPAVMAPLLGLDASRISVIDVQAVDADPSLLSVTFQVSPDGEGAGAGDLIARVNAAVGDGSVVSSVEATSTGGVCGNDLCEYGEACSSAAADSSSCCPNDCPITLHACPTPDGTNQQCGGERRGRCVMSTGACECWPGAGYTGDDCGACQSGFAMSSSLECKPVFDVDTGFGSLDAGMPAWALAALVIVGVFVFGGVVYCVCRSQGRCGGGKASGGDLPRFSGAVSGASVRYT